MEYLVLGFVLYAVGWLTGYVTGYVWTINNLKLEKVKSTINK